jgi:hypothetical protein
VIRTPIDFERLIGAEDFSLTKLISPPPEVEAGVRALLAAIFDDLPEIDSEDPRLVTAYLESIKDPLGDLYAIGLQLVARTITGRMALSGATVPGAPGSVPWRRTQFVVATRPCFFRTSGDGLVHVLASRCSSAADGLTAEGAEVRAWASEEGLDVAFEGSIPWCDTCFLER